MNASVNESVSVSASVGVGVGVGVGVNVGESVGVGVGVNVGAGVGVGDVNPGNYFGGGEGEEPVHGYGWKEAAAGWSMVGQPLLVLALDWGHQNHPEVVLGRLRLGY